MMLIQLKIELNNFIKLVLIKYHNLWLNYQLHILKNINNKNKLIKKKLVFL